MPDVSFDDPLVKDFIIKQAGEDSHKIIKCLENGRTDEQISKKVGMNVNEIRAALNKLHYLGVIVYSKEKAKESNWYTYTWFARKDRIFELLNDRFGDELRELEGKLSFEKTYTFFKCTNGCNKLPFELAFEYDFKCPECGKVMDVVNNEIEAAKIKEKV
ncbi:MAG: hypothetical protein V1911_03345, partial [Candidatus Micrarchaeota archaeon]